ncbi:MAG: GAF domain-containing protein [Chloroflexi bacterium]|nr:GAF domain-containing protein [Chloroflexota bacterium]
MSEPQAVIWLGDSSLLLEAVWTRFEVVHVRHVPAMLRAVERRLASLVVIDTALPGIEPGILDDCLRTWGSRICTLLLVPPGMESQPRSGARVMSRNAPRSEVLATLHELAEGAESPAASESGPLHVPEPAADPDDLRSRIVHLEGLVQAAFNIPHLADEGDILGDLRSVARIAVDADEMAVLLADDHYTDLTDALNLGVAAEYLDVCREHLKSLAVEDRLFYLGDEVLLRERMPDMLPSAMRVREASAAGAWSYIRVPLIVDQQLNGFIALFSDTPGRFNGAHLQLARLFSAQVANAVRNMRLYVRLNSAEQRQHAVSEVARLITEDLALDAVLARIVGEAVRLVQGHSGAVFLPQDDKLILSAVYNMPLEAVGFQVPADEGLAGQVAQTGEPGVVVHYREWETALGTAKPHIPEDGILYAVPLIYRGEVRGVLEVVSLEPGGDMVEEQKDVLMLLAPQAATAIVKAQLHEMVRQERQQLLAILDHTNVVVIVCDADGRVLLANPEARRVLAQWGFVAAALEGQRVGDLLGQLLPGHGLRLDDIGHALEINLGAAGEYLLHIAPITRLDGTVERYVGIAQDVSQFRRLDRMKSDMIHILSHDLGNKLGLARGSLDLLEEPDLPADQRELLSNMIVNSLDQMEQLVRDVTDLEAAESSGQETAVPYDLCKLARQVINTQEPKAMRQQVKLVYQEIDPPASPLQGNALMVGQAIENLVGNAIKYTPAGGKVTVTATTEGNVAVLRVEDTGYGIPADKLPFIFEQFFRVPDKRVRHIPGTGLGLSLVRTIAVMHGGQITVESEPDVGSTFVLRLPMEGPDITTAGTSQITRLDLSTVIQPKKVEGD